MHHPREKIRNIVGRGQGVPDPDAPNDPNSVQFWCRRKGKINETETVEQSTTVQMHGRATTQLVESVTSGALGEITPGFHGLPVQGVGAPDTQATLALADQLGNQGAWLVAVRSTPNLENEPP